MVGYILLSAMPKLSTQINRNDLPMILQTHKPYVEHPVSLEGNWADMRCKIFSGDNRDVIPDLEENSVDLVVTSPPYFQQRSYSAEGIGNEDTVEEYLDNVLQTFQLLLRVVKPTGSIVYNMGDKNINGSFMLVQYRFAIRVIDELGLKLVNDITWVKQNPAPHQFRRRLTSSTEPFFHFALTNDYYYDRDSFMPELATRHNKPSPRLGEGYRDLIDNSELHPDQRANAHRALDEAVQDVRDGVIHSFRMKIRGIHAPAYGGQDGGRKIHMEREGFTIIRINGQPMKRDVIQSPVGSLKGNGHPAIFPEKVIREMIRLLTPENGTVLDHYMGSGTTLVAALKERRNCIGIDTSEDYCASAVRRIHELESAPVATTFI